MLGHLCNFPLEGMDYTNFMILVIKTCYFVKSVPNIISMLQIIFVLEALFSDKFD